VTGTTLRRLEARDAVRVLEAFTFADDMARQGQVTTLPEAETYVARLLDPQGTHLPFAMVGEQDLLLGLVALSVDAENLNAWFWYWTHPSGRRRGWTGRAAATVANWALTTGGLHRLELGHRANNLASRGVALAAGFIYEGTEREKFLVGAERIDVLTYGRLASDPVPTTEPLRILAVP
jgi:hypothetical fusion protein